MTARPHKTICISAYEDDLAALDAFIEGCPGLDRSKLIRLALATVGIIPAQQTVAWPKNTERAGREFSELVQSTFGLGAVRSGMKGRKVTEKKRKGTLPTEAA